MNLSNTVAQDTIFDIKPKEADGKQLTIENIWKSTDCILFDSRMLRL